TLAGPENSDFLKDARSYGIVMTERQRNARCYSARPGDDAEFEWDSPAVENAAGSSSERSRAAERRLDSFGKSRQSERRRGRSAKSRKPLSPAARKKIAAAQRARWAKWKAARRRK